MKVTVKHYESEITVEIPETNIRRHPIENYGALKQSGTSNEDHEAPMNRLLALLDKMADTVIRMEKGIISNDEKPKQ
jgi:hypothetical protein